jgi:predicted GIY-YIG superfamily endonuclease
MNESIMDKEVTMPKLKKQLAERWFVYILRCADDSLYTGITKDLDRRLKQHNAGTASRYTRGRLPVTREYQEEQPNQSMALKREFAIKAMSRQEKELLIRRLVE